MGMAFWGKAPGDDLLLHGLSHTTIGAVAFHFRVRDGIGWFHNAMVTRETVGGFAVSTVCGRDTRTLSRSVLRISCGRSEVCDETSERVVAKVSIESVLLSVVSFAHNARRSLRLYGQAARIISIG